MATSRSGNLGVDAQHTPEAGDWIEVAATGEGSPQRGVIVAVLGEDRHMHFRVRWDEEHVSLFYPAERRFIVHRASSRTSSEARSSGDGNG
jgi:hypothetical protein